jgi:arabinogalactan oligomer / maltooligosaccharide transport system permease protein
MFWLIPFQLALADEADKTDILIWHSYRGEERSALEGVLEEYEKQNPQYNVVSLALPYDAFINRLEAGIPRGNGPDLFIAAHEKIGTWVNSGLIEPLQSSQQTDLHPTTLKAISYDGKQYGIPLAFKCLALFVNDDLLEEVPKTTDDLINLSKTQTQFLAYQATTPYFHAMWMHGFGGGLFDENNKAQLNSNENIASFTFLLELQNKKIIPEEPTSALVSQLFNQKQVPLVINGPWFLGEISEDVNYSVHPLPTISQSGLPSKPFLTVEAALLSSQSKQKEGAIQLAEYLASTDVAIQRVLEGRQSVATLSAYESPKVNSDKVISAFKSQLDASIPLPNIPKMSSTWEPMGRALRRITRGALTPKAALDQAQIEYNILQRPPPTKANSIPYAIIASLIFFVLCGYLVRQYLQHKSEIHSKWSSYLYVAPAAFAMTLLTAIPFIVGACVSLFAHHNGEFTFVGLANFLDILFARDWPVTSSLSFYYTLVVTILWTVTNLFLHVGIGIAMAMILREPWIKMRALYRVLLILPWAVPNYITALIWKGMFHRQFGAVNALLESVGVEGISWFSQFSTAFCANLITNTWLGFPFMMVVTLGALQSIPRDLEQAAEIDGASGWQRFWYITLPLLKPALLPAVILGSVWTFNMFNIIYLVSAGEPDSATDILISDAYRWAFSRGSRYGYASAYAVLIFFILLGYSKIGNKIAGRKTL